MLTIIGAVVVVGLFIALCPYILTVIVLLALLIAAAVKRILNKLIPRRELW